MHLYLNGILQLADYDFLYSKNNHVLVMLNGLQKGDNLKLEIVGKNGVKLTSTLKIRYIRKPVKYLAFNDFLVQLN